MRPHGSGLLLCVGVAVALAGCGSSSTGSSDTIASLSGTNFVVEPTVPAVTTTTLAPLPGDVIAGATTYVVKDGDLPYTIASKYQVGLNDLITLNGWTLQGTGSSQYVTNFPPAGTEIKIPAGAKVPGADATPTTGGAAPGITSAGDPTPPSSTQPGAATESTAAGTQTSSTVAGGGDNCKPGSYTITKDDITRDKVAKKFDITSDQLDAANTGTNGYKAFYPGLKIVIPAKSNC